MRGLSNGDGTTRGASRDCYGHLWVGTSGWVYKHWRGVFYPSCSAGPRQLSFYARHFDTVEVNYSFYRLPTRENFERWREETPPGFLFAVKASRFLTHVKWLKDAEEPVSRLLDRAGGLGEKLGPVLFQFPPDWPKNLERLQSFLPLLPAGHRYTFEFRHESWLSPDVYETLKEAGCALCVPDHPGMPQAWVVTADFTYVRMHSGKTSASFTDGELESWAARIRPALDDGIDVYVYFNNDVHGYALRNATLLRQLLGQVGVTNARKAS